MFMTVRLRCADRFKSQSIVAYLLRHLNDNIARSFCLRCKVHHERTLVRWVGSRLVQYKMDGDIWKAASLVPVRDRPLNAHLSFRFYS